MTEWKHLETEWLFIRGQISASPRPAHTEYGDDSVGLSVGMKINPVKQLLHMTTQLIMWCEIVQSPNQGQVHSDADVELISRFFSDYTCWDFHFIEHIKILHLHEEQHHERNWQFWLRKINPLYYF